MKRITLLALSATVAMAEAPAAAPAAAEATEASSAPLAPIHDNLVFSNPALPGSIGTLMLTPTDFYGKREAAFQWDGSTGVNFDGTGLAVVDQYFTGFSSVGEHGQLAGGYITQQFGAGLRLNVHKISYSNDDAAFPADPVKEAHYTYAPTGLGLFGSVPMGDRTAYGHVDYSTPAAYYDTTFKTATDNVTHASRADSISIGAGLQGPAMGDKGISWTIALELAYNRYRNAGVSDDDAEKVYFMLQTAGIGKTFSSGGYILATGLNEAIGYRNGKGGRVDRPDWGYGVYLTPTLATILPVFEHWTVKGGTGLEISYSSYDPTVGEPAHVTGLILSANPSALFGVRFEHGRWAAEAQVMNAFLNHGPNFVSGQAGDLFGSFAVTANFK